MTIGDQKIKQLLFLCAAGAIGLSMLGGEFLASCILARRLRERAGYARELEKILEEQDLELGRLQWEKEWGGHSQWDLPAGANANWVNGIKSPRIPAGQPIDPKVYTKYGYPPGYRAPELKPYDGKGLIQNQIRYSER